MATAVPLKSGSRCCSSCERDGISNTAHSYCFNCDSMLCVDCDKAHNKFVKDHRVVYGDDMSVHDTDDKQAFVLCKVHSTENIDLYCKDHEEVLCNVCKYSSHRKCDVQDISSACAEVDVSKFRNEVTTQVMTLLGTAEKTVTNNQSSLDKVNEHKDEIKHKIEFLRAEINCVFDRYLQQLNIQHASKIDLLISNIKVCKGINAHLTQENDKLKRNEGHSLRELIKLIETNKLCKEYTATLKDISNETVSSEYTITEDDKLKSLIQQISDMGHKKVTDSEEVAKDGIATPKKKSFLKIKECLPVKEKDIKMINDSETPDISGCCFIPNGRLVICDRYNKKVKFLTMDMKIFYSIVFQEEPWDVACLGDYQIVVTIPKSKSMEYIEIKPGIQPRYKVDVGHPCFGVAVHENSIFVAIADHEKKIYGIQVLEGFGRKLYFIEQRDIGNPKCVCTNTDGSKIYYSAGSYSSLFIKCLTKEGHGLIVIRAATLKDLNTLICDDDGNLIACDVFRGSKCIHLIESQGDVCGTILSEKDGYLQSMCFDQANDLLAVASCQDKIAKITTYKFKYDL